MKTIKIFLKLCELNLKKLLIYRASFAISLVLMGVWVAAYAALIEVIFYHTDSLAGFKKGQVILIMAMYYFIQNLSDIFFKGNFEDFGESVRRGELDFRLTKPVSPRLLSFFWEIRFDHAAGLIVTGALFSYALKTLDFEIHYSDLALGALLSLVSLTLYFNILSIIATMAFWIHRNDTFNVLMFNVSQLSRYPRQIYRGALGKILTFGLPLALISTIPSEAILNYENSPLTAYLIIVAVLFYIAAKIFWNIGIKSYTSAN